MRDQEKDMRDDIQGTFILDETWLSGIVMLQKNTELEKVLQIWYVFSLSSFRYLVGKSVLCEIAKDLSDHLRETMEQIPS